MMRIEFDYWRCAAFCFFAPIFIRIGWAVGGAFLGLFESNDPTYF